MALALNADKHVFSKDVYLFLILTSDDSSGDPGSGNLGKDLVKGKLRESDPVPRNIPVILPDK